MMPIGLADDAYLAGSWCTSGAQMTIIARAENAHLRAG